MVQGGDDGRAPPLQEEEHHDGEGEVGDPGSGDAAGDAVSSGPAAHGEHQETHARVQLSVEVEQLRALDRHPVGNTQNCYWGFFVAVYIINVISYHFHFHKKRKYK